MRNINEISIDEKYRILELYSLRDGLNYLNEANEVLVTNYDPVWDYKKVGNDYYAKKKGDTNWILAKNNVKRNIAKKVFKSQPTNNINQPTQTNVSSNSVNFSDFNSIVSSIINNFEGGYYHPNMLKDGRLRDSRYRNSGETMFGMDRKRGVDFANTSAGKEFWSLIDNSNASNTWKWNYFGGELKPKLEQLVAGMIKPFFDRYSSAYLTPESKSIVNSNNKLKYNFIYAVWNGPKWFKRFANIVNNHVAKGQTNGDQLNRMVIDARINSGNSLIRQTGNKLNKIIG